MEMLGPLLFSYYRRRVLGLLLLQPEASYHVREIARLTGTTAGTLHKELAALAQGGILKRAKVGNQLHYSANRECPIFDELASILRKTSGIAEVLAKALAGIEARISVAFVFGSVARGSEQSASDIDVLLVGTLRLADAVRALHPAQKVLGREINAVVFNPQEFRRKLHGRDAFLKEVLAKSKIFLIGSEHDLGKLAQDRAA